ncbi:DUF2339 domain-containing protein [Nocardia puris]|uniref:Putative membrane protein DUF2339 n=1 Tax=Nocardia puris TaxID=208602 RepID=A0A366DN11_9NOCA|nr:DUF2339 domain-containing protein [Nocardia puris]RBO91446.1 putative membrane protein DUF2339 [Nocardia puris]
MTTSLDPALISRLSGEFTALGTRMGVLGRDLALLREQVAADLTVPRSVSWKTGASAEAEVEAGRSAVPGTAEAGAPVGTRPESAGAMSRPPAETASERSGALAGAQGVTDASAPTEAGRSAVGVPDAAGEMPGASGSTPGGGDRTSVGAEAVSSKSAGASGSTPAGEPAGVGGPRSADEAGDAGAAEGASGFGSTGSARAEGSSGTAMPDTSAATGAPGGVPVPPPGQWNPGQWQAAGQQGWPGGAVPYPLPGYAPGYAGRPPQGWPPRGPVPHGGGAVPPGMRPPPVRKQPGVPWWQRDGVISRVLAIAGVGVTLIGVVMLLVLAAQAGLYGPVARVATGAVLSAGLVVAGMRVFGRTGGRVGGIALAGTGIAGAYLNVVAVTAYYEWLHPVLGLAVALAVAAGGVALAVQWKSQPLAVLVVLGAALLSPFVTSELVLLAFLIVLQFACLPVQLGREWPFLHVARTVPVVLAALVSIAVATFDTVEQDRALWLLAAASAIAVVGLAGTLIMVRAHAQDVTATAMFAVATLPLLAVPVLFDRYPAALIAGVAAAVLLAVAAVPLIPKLRDIARIPGHTAIAAAVTGSFALLEACIGVTNAQTLPIATLLVALAFLAVAGQVRSVVAAGIGVVFALLGGLVLLDAASPETLASQRFAEEQLGVSTVLAALLGIAVVAVAVWGVRRLPGMAKGGTEESVLWLAASLLTLYLVTAAFVSIGVATGVEDGFIIGHSVATIGWMAAATAALFYGLRNLARKPSVAKVALAAGLLVTAAALAKLFLFDLATLDGLVRVAVFLAVGILLLLTGTRYARAFAEAGEREPEQNPAA